MNCKGFKNLVADFIAGRLERETAERMVAHREVCAYCTKVEEEEHDLRLAFKNLHCDSMAAPADLWPPVASRIASINSTSPDTSKHGRIREALSAKWTFGIALAAVAGVLLLGTLAHTDSPRSLITFSGTFVGKSSSISPSDSSDERVVVMVSDMRSVSASEPDVLGLDDGAQVPLHGASSEEPQ